jgi:predicted nicotinamide N-methyase
MTDKLLPHTPIEVLGPTRREQVIIDGWTFLIDRPTDTDEDMPHWIDLWPAARMLAKWIVRQTWPAGLRALEIGCGLGLPGIAALAMGVPVTFSDRDATALQFASANARLNGFTDFDTLPMDWNAPPEALRVPVLLASDLIYEERNVAPLVALIRRLLPAEGVCLLTDQDRVPSAVLKRLLSEQSMPFTTQFVRAGEPGGRRLKGTLYRITQPGGRDPLTAVGHPPRDRSTPVR